MRILIVFVSVVSFACGGPGMAQTPLTPLERARIAMALSKAFPLPPYPDGQTEKARGCQCGTKCNCTAGECGAKDCPSPAKPGPNEAAPGPWEWALYEVAYKRAVRANLPLLIWLGETCPSAEQAWTECVHARLSEIDSPSRGVEKGPVCIVCKPDGLGGMDRVATINGIPTRAEVDALVAPAPPVPMPQQPRFVPMMMPPPMMMGGFGGFGGGGCGGGG